MDREIQVARLRTAGASGAQIEELLRYNESTFEKQGSELGASVPLPDEPFAECWASWAQEARQRGLFPVLASYLPQLAFPIQEGISRSEAYRGATLRGIATASMEEATGLSLERPDLLELELYPSLAGRLPVLVARRRADFVALVQALARRNEPVPVPEAQGAVMVAGYNNWERIRQLRYAWEALDPDEEFKLIRARKELYQDRFILLSDGPYSGVPAAELGLDESEWREMSLVLRREHECTHYFTRRYFGSMRNHVLDELIADYMGIVAARGRFRADWFLRFVGLEDYPRYRLGARLDLYRGDPPLSKGAFEVLHTLVKDAAAQVESFDARWPAGTRSPEQQALSIRALASLSLVELASPKVEDVLEGFLARNAAG